MANEQNLIKNEDLTPEQRRKNASKAGKASAAARKKRKTLKEELLLLLETENYMMTMLKSALGIEWEAVER